jgi:hypothetical protein
MQTPRLGICAGCGWCDFILKASSGNAGIRRCSFAQVAVLQANFHPLSWVAIKHAAEHTAFGQ